MKRAFSVCTMGEIRGHFNANGPQEAEAHPQQSVPSSYSSREDPPSSARVKSHLPRPIIAQLVRSEKSWRPIATMAHANDSLAGGARVFDRYCDSLAKPHTLSNNGKGEAGTCQASTPVPRDERTRRIPRPEDAAPYTFPFPLRNTFASIGSLDWPLPVSIERKAQFSV